ncbi:hypothetical protein Pmani_002130 [Petrolisthes manimaculis]|uniref:Uncharacterized protein n=1 Tax=Petrolisthes manimaculis TaxID=1843537 RepID=A0AAE1QIP2_9EUCA|nr:hypothetical protein Pmani_002130 [Petrolisthes manimaculis]
MTEKSALPAMCQPRGKCFVITTSLRPSPPHKSVNEESSMDDDSFFELLSRFQSKQMADQRSTLSLDNHRESNNTEKRSRPLMERSNSSQMEHKPQPVPQQ